MGTIIVGLDPDIGIREDTLAHQELSRLTVQTARGDYGIPLRFLAGAEIEAQFSELPDEHFDDQTLSELREAVRFDVLEVQPQSDLQARTRQLWLDQIHDFNRQDLFNFLIYSSFSRPTLEPGDCPTGVSYDEMLAHTAASGVIAYRFGRKPYEWSYYDHPRVSEWRANPVAPSELGSRVNELTAHILDEARCNGLSLSHRGFHIQPNISVYHQVENGDWLPILGIEPDKLGATFDALAGIGASIQDGAWFSSALTPSEWRDMFHPPSENTLTFSIGTSRQHSVRLAGERIEIRTDELKPTLNQALLWSIAGISYGLEQGVEAIRSQPGRSTPELVPVPIVTQTERYDEIRHRLLKQMIKQSDWCDQTLIGDRRLIARYGELFVEQLVGTDKPKAEAAQFFCELFLRCIEFDEAGRLDAKGRIQLVLASAAQTEPQRLAALSDAAGSAEALMAQLVEAADFLLDDALRVHLENHPTITTNLPARSLAAWLEHRRSSETVQRAYGKHIDAHTKFLDMMLAHHSMNIPT